MKKWIFAASVALIVMFAMVGCKTDEPGPGPGPTPPPPPPPPANEVTITFNPNYTGSEPSWTLKIEEDTTIDPLPRPKARAGYVFAGWWNANETIEYTTEYPFPANTTLFAKWIKDELTVTDAQELLYLTNGGYAIYQFVIPSGKVLDDYDKLSIDFKVSEAGLHVWDKNGLRGVRLYGVFTSNTPVSTASNAALYGLPDVKYFNISGQDENGKIMNTAYRVTNPSATPIRSSAEADTWFTVEHNVAGDGNTDADFVAQYKPATITGTVYFALGLSCQNTNGGANREVAFMQAVKNIKLVPKVAADGDVAGTKPAAANAQFLSNNDPIVFEWRGDPTPENYANPPLPAVPEDVFDRGDPPAIASLVKVELGAFTYINRNNPNNQLGWTSFGESGRANDNSYTGAPSTITFNNFKEAWYLVLETTAKTDGETRLVWMGGAGGWNSNLVTNNSGAIDGISEIIPDNEENPTKYTIRFLLPKALTQYGRYYNDNTDWAAFCIQYFQQGDSSVPMSSLGITSAYLLLEADDAEGEAKGIVLGLSFNLGATAPASGALIDDISLAVDEGVTDLIVTAGSGLTEYRWYVDGTPNAEITGTLTIANVSAGDVKIVTLQAKRDGKWVSQAVNITVKNQ